MTERESLSIFWQNARVRKEKRENKLLEFLSLSFYSISGLKWILFLLISCNLNLLKSPSVKVSSGGIKYHDISRMTQFDQQ